ncbi:tryptophan-rich sensory protein [Microbacterium sp. LjRoot45]|uniref:tryptophan-rich sensory protein n=1 Tax=Microbacterium sp. LjRoot45 TaxID=3342329 RepID=UPI003ECEBA82
MNLRSDILRQVAVISAVSFMIVAAMVGTGFFGGTNVRDLQGGALDADATVLAPDRPAFGIWSVIYALLIAYAVWQALPGQRARHRQQAAGWWIALTAVLNGGWLLAAQFTTLPVTVLAIVVLLVALGVTLRVLTRVPQRTVADVVFMDLMVGLHLGWVALATVANVTAWLTAEVAPASWADAAVPVAVAVLAVVAVVGAAVAWGTRGRLAPALAMAWGLTWIGVARATGEPASMPIAVAAWVAAAIVLLAPVIVWATGRGRGELRGLGAERRDGLRRSRAARVA